MGHIEVTRKVPTRSFFWDEFLEDAREWARGRMWIPRALLLAILVYVEILKLRDASRWTIFYGITLGFHEMGHLVFAWAPQFITVLMGSVFQVAVPVVVMASFYRQRDYFGMSVGGFWLSYSLFELSAYVGDARAQQLPLVGFAAQEDLEHDWHYLLEVLRMLPLDTTLAFLLKVAAFGAGMGSLAFAVWLLMQMARSSR
jgi:hypothetical protein